MGFQVTIQPGAGRIAIGRYAYFVGDDDDPVAVDLTADEYDRLDPDLFTGAPVQDTSSEVETGQVLVLPGADRVAIGHHAYYCPESAEPVVITMSKSGYDFLGDEIYGPFVQQVPPLLQEAVWRVDARRNGSGASMVDLAAGLTSTPPEPNPKILTPSSFVGEALIGQMTLIGGTTDTEWFTDLDVRWTSTVLPHHANNSAGQWGEVLNIPVAETSNERDWLEPAFVFQDDGDICVGVDWDSADADDPGSWISDPIGQWADGLPRADYRVTVVAATGAVTLYIDDVEVQTDTVGATTFPEPPDASECNAGAIQYLVALHSITVLDGIDGDPIIAFDAEEPSGWASGASGGGVVTAPARPAWGPAAAIVGHTFAADPLWTLPADEDRTFAISIQAMPTVGSAAAWLTLTPVIDQLFSAAEGWMLADVPVAGVNMAARLNDGATTVSASLGAQGFTDRTLVVVVDRTLDEARTYLDGDLVDTEDISGLGAVDPATVLTAFGARCWGYSANIWSRALDDAEIAELDELL